MQDETKRADVLVRADGLTKIYHSGRQAIPVLRGVSLHVLRGEFVAMIGSSGSGKSTLLHVLGLLDSFDQGTYFLAGEDAGKLSERAAARLRNRAIGFVFQSFHLLPQKRAWENVALPLGYQGVARREQRRRACELLERLKLSGRSEHRPTELSGGQRQRVAIARALITDPPLILADEPTGNLDSEATEEVLKLFAEIRGEGRTIVLVTHDPGVARVADRVVVMRDGVFAEAEGAS